MNKKKRLLEMLFALALGASIGAMIAVMVTPVEVFRFRTPLEVRGRFTPSIILPEETLLVGIERMHGSPDLGWWGCLPVAFTHGADAELLLKPAKDVQKTDYYRQLFASRAAAGKVEDDSKLEPDDAAHN